MDELPVGELSLSELSVGRIFRWANCPWVNCPRANCQRAHCPWANSPATTFFIMEPFLTNFQHISMETMEMSDEQHCSLYTSCDSIQICFEFY